MNIWKDLFVVAALKRVLSSSAGAASATASSSLGSAIFFVCLIALGYFFAPTGHDAAFKFWGIFSIVMACIAFFLFDFVKVLVACALVIGLGVYIFCYNFSYWAASLYIGSILMITSAGRIILMCILFCAAAFFGYAYLHNSGIL